MICLRNGVTKRGENARRGQKARHVLYDPTKKLNKQIQEEETEHRLAKICNLSSALNNLRLGGNGNEDGNEMVELQAGGE